MRNKRSILMRVLALVLCLLLLAGCAPKAGPEAAPLEPDDWAGVVAQFGSHTLTSVDFSYYYWSSYLSFLTYHGSEAQNYIDLYTPLDQQMYTDELTWQDYFIENALMAFKQYSALNDLADAAGFELSETAQNALDRADEDLLKTAQGMGFDNVEDYLVANYGTGATLESYVAFMHDQFVVSEYTAQLQESFTFTDEEVEAYYDEHEEEYLSNGILKHDVRMAQIRYLMLLAGGTSDEDYEALDATFDAMLEDWETWEDKSEEGFMSFGEKWSEQGFAQDYLDAVAPDQVEFSYFDDWAFGEPREAGDTRTYYKESGDYMFYYVGQTDDIYWLSQTRYDMSRDAFTSFLLEQISAYTYSVHEENIIISAADDLYADVDDILDSIVEVD